VPANLEASCLLEISDVSWKSQLPVSLVCPHPYNSFTDYNLAVNSIKLMMDFRNTHVFSVKRVDADNSTNFAAGRIINCRTHHNSLQIHEQTPGDHLCEGLQGNESCDYLTCENSRFLLH
jgi:hypothetical protein